MACFIVPAAEAVVTTVITKVTEKKHSEKNEAALQFTDKLRWLNKMLWGGSVLLAFEHVWHGEVQPFFPFLTAVSDPAETASMLHEMATVGVGMAGLVTAAWVGMVLVTGMLSRKSTDARGAEQ